MYSLTIGLAVSNEFMFDAYRSGWNPHMTLQALLVPIQLRDDGYHDDIDDCIPFRIKTKP